MSWDHVGPSLSYKTCKAQNVILQEVQSFCQLTVISAMLKALFLSLTNSEGGFCLTCPLSSESKIQKTHGKGKVRKE